MNDSRTATLPHSVVFGYPHSAVTEGEEALNMALIMFAVLHGRIHLQSDSDEGIHCNEALKRIRKCDEMLTVYNVITVHVKK